MGNGGSQNDDFSKNPNFNMNQHKQAMQHLSSNYTAPNLNIPLQGNSHANVEQTQFKKVTRNCSIYKPSFNIHILGDAFILQFEYDCSGPSRVEVYGGVMDVQEDPSSQITLRIDSKVKYSGEVSIGKKLKFKETYRLNGYEGLANSTLIIRMISTTSSQISEYSLKRVLSPNEHWKVLLEKLQLNGLVTQLQNIYKGDQANECLVCLTNTSDTLIEPCNHLCLCSQCMNMVRQSTNKCPICRNGIGGFKVIVSS